MIRTMSDPHAMLVNDPGGSADDSRGAAGGQASAGPDTDMAATTRDAAASSRSEDGIPAIIRRIQTTSFPIRKTIALVVALILGAAMFYVPWEALAEALLSAAPLPLLAAALVNISIFPLWATQWRLLALPARAISWMTMFEIVALSSLANHVLTSAAGATSAGAMLMTRGGLTAVGAASLIVIDQMLVGFAKITLLLMALALAPIPPEAIRWIVALSAFLTAAFVALLALAVFHARVQRCVDRVASLNWLVAPLRHLSRSLTVIRSPGLLASVAVLALAKKATEIGAAFAVQFACGIEPSFAAAVLAVAAVSVTTMVPVVPGNLGVYTAAVFAVYQSLGVPAPQALAAGLLQQAVDVVPSLLVGYATLLNNRTCVRSDPPSRPQEDSRC
jgi:uncharacterized membrane protein YbhN (UPF0104 family)